MRSALPGNRGPLQSQADQFADELMQEEQATSAASNKNAGKGKGKKKKKKKKK